MAKKLYLNSDSTEKYLSEEKIHFPEQYREEQKEIKKYLSPQRPNQKTDIKQKCPICGDVFLYNNAQPNL